MWIWSKLVSSSKTFLYSSWLIHNVLKGRGKGHSYQYTTFRFKTLFKTRCIGQAVCGGMLHDSYLSLKPSASKLSNNEHTVRYFGTRKYKYALHSSSFLIRRKEALILILLGITGGVVYGWNKKIESDKFDRKMHEINEIIKKAQKLYGAATFKIDCLKDLQQKLKCL